MTHQRGDLLLHVLYAGSIQITTGLGSICLRLCPAQFMVGGVSSCTLTLDMAELVLDGGSREEQLAEGIVGILSPAVEQVDQQIGEVR